MKKKLEQMEKYLKTLNTLSANQKAEFLEKILQNSPDLQKQLLNYFQTSIAIEKQNDMNFESLVIQFSKEYIEQLEALDLENPDYDREYNFSGRYYKHWEMDQLLVEDEVNELFDGFSAEMMKDTAKGDIQLVMAQLVALLSACKLVKIDDPNFNLGGDPNEAFLMNFNEVVDVIKPEISKTIFNTETVSISIFQTIDYCTKQPNTSIFYPIDLIIAFVLEQNTDSCIAVNQIFNKNTSWVNVFPISYLESIKNQPEEWVKEAEKHSPTNLLIAKRLLEYLAIYDIQSFHFSAKELFSVFPTELLDLIAASVDTAIDFDFAKEIWLIKTKRSLKVADYSRLVSMLYKTEKIDFIESYKTSTTKKFYVEILEYERRYGHIMQFVSSIKLSIYELKDLLLPIITIYPSECYQIIEQEIKSHLINHVSRDSYALSASLLTFLLSDSRNTEKVRQLKSELCKTYSRRPALLNEFSQIPL